MSKITKEEARDKFMRNAMGIVKHWARQEDMSCEEKCDGVLFSILSMIDGTNLGLPAMDIVLRPHPEDKEFSKQIGEDWYEDGMAINDDTMLHEIMHKYE